MLEDVRTVVIELVGEFDIARTAQLRDAILTEHTDGANVAVDVSKVTFIDSSALRALLEVRNVLADQGAVLSLVQPTENVIRLLSITATAELFGLGEGEIS